MGCARPPPLPVLPIERDMPDLPLPATPETVAGLRPVLLSGTQSSSRRPLSEVLASFMERKNIRWGELIGGLLIVGCSIALVLSFWAQIQQRPLMKFSIFTAVTTGLFALGLYSEHRWKLATTSRGILLTATLLIPLNFLAFAAFSRGVPATDPIALGGECVAFVLFFALARSSARVIAPLWPDWHTIGVMALSAGTLAVRYLSVNDSGVELSSAGAMGLAAMIVAVYGIVSCGFLSKLWRGKSLDLADANIVLLSLGILSFAAILPMALIVTRGGDDSLHRLAPLIGLVGLPALAGGILLRKRIIDEAGASVARMHVAGTAVSVVGSAVLLASIVPAWPSPAEILVISSIAFVAFLTVALSEISGSWFGLAQAAATVATGSAVLFVLDPDAATTHRMGALLTRISTWRSLAVAWAALSLVWALLRITVRRIRPASDSASSDPVALPTWRASARQLERLSFTFERLLSALLLVMLGLLSLATVFSGALTALASLVQIAPSDAVRTQMALTVSGSLPWLVLAILLAAHTANTFEELKTRIDWQALMISWIACPLMSAQYSGGMQSGEAAFRWATTAWLLLFGGIIRGRFGFVRRILNGSTRAGTSANREIPAHNSSDALLLILGVLPVLILSLYGAGEVIFGNGVEVAIRATGSTCDCIVPMLAVVAFLTGQALVCRSNGYALAAMLSIELLVSTAYLVAMAPGVEIDTLHLVRLIQLNIAAAACASLVWLFGWLVASKREPSGSAPPVLLGVCIWTALAANGLLIAPVAGELFLMPNRSPGLSDSVGGIWGWIALGLSSVSGGALVTLRRQSPVRMAGLAFPLIAAPFAVSATAWDRGNWFSFHVWMGVQTAAAWAIVGKACWIERRRQAVLSESIGPEQLPDTTQAALGQLVSMQNGETAIVLGYQAPTTSESQRKAASHARLPALRMAGMLGMLAVILSLRASLGDPAAPASSAAVIVFVGLLAAAVAVWIPAPAALYAAAGLLNLAATLVYRLDRARIGRVSALGVIEINIVALVLPAIAWLVLELQVFRRSFQGRNRAWAVHRFAAFASITLLAAVIGLDFSRSMVGTPATTAPWLDATVFVAMAALFIACLWDAPPLPALSLLYALGLIGCVRALEYVHLSNARTAWAGTP